MKTGFGLGRLEDWLSFICRRGKAEFVQPKHQSYDRDFKGRQGRLKVETGARLALEQPRLVELETGLRVAGAVSLVLIGSTGHGAAQTQPEAPGGTLGRAGAQGVT